jgi:putative ABC transport system ATP-binding protein
MKISLQNIRPLHIVQKNIDRSDIWGVDEFLFEEGEIYQVKGISGQGKSTLISFIYGNRSDYTGNIFMDDKKLREYKSFAWSDVRCKQISIVFQGLELFDELTGYDNVLIKNRLTGYKSKKEIKEYAARLEIADLMNRKVSTFSYGQKQRLSIIRSLCQPFECILLDEPFSHLDDRNKAEAIHLLSQEIEKRNAMAIITTLEKEKALKSKEYNV